jgi:hypothetical protein
MLLDPYLDKHLTTTYAGTRLLEETFDLVGAEILDPDNKQRRWTLKAFYAPVRGRMLGGLRAKLTDQKGFVTFCNQRDLEVLIGLAEPGTFCPWARKYYVAPGDKDWYGLVMDDDDLEDDLHDREMLLRAASPTGILLGNLEIVRRLHLDTKYDVEELNMLLWDADPETGLTPDLRLETVDRRWKRVERTRMQWEYMRSA